MHYKNTWNTWKLNPWKIHEDTWKYIKRVRRHEHGKMHENAWTYMNTQTRNWRCNMKMDCRSAKKRTDTSGPRFEKSPITGMFSCSSDWYSPGIHSTIMTHLYIRKLLRAINCVMRRWNRETRNHSEDRWTCNWKEHSLFFVLHASPKHCREITPGHELNCTWSQRDG